MALGIVRIKDLDAPNAHAGEELLLVGDRFLSQRAMTEP
jgi:hypothetical protein